MTFSASYDRFAKIVSAFVCLGLLAAIAISQSIVMFILGLVAVFISFAYSPRGYIVDGRSILVRRLAGNARIALDDVREVRRATPDNSRGCIRLRGSGGLFGYYGLFRSDALGKFNAYTTSRQNNVVVIAGLKTAVFSPDDVDGFLAAIHAVAPTSASFVAPAFDATRRYRSRRFGPLLVALGAILAVAAIGLGIAANVYAPGPPAYTLTPTALTIHDRFFPVTLQADAIDAANIRIVDLSADSEWRPTRRTDGFANSHYQSGWFQAANGRKMRLYQAGGQRLVLLPPRGDGTPVLYQAADPEAFVSAVRAAWAGQKARK